MDAERKRALPVSAGDVDGKGRVYSQGGALILHPTESLLHVADNWDVDVVSPWRRVMPNVLFAGLNGVAHSRLYITDRRIVLVRQVDSWREVKGDMTPLGMPNAIAKKARLDFLHSSGVFQFCEVHPSGLRLVSSKRRAQPNSWMSLKLVGTDGTRYGIMIWKSDGTDEQTLAIIVAQFQR